MRVGYVGYPAGRGRTRPFNGHRVRVARFVGWRLRPVLARCSPKHVVSEGFWRCLGGLILRMPPFILRNSTAYCTKYYKTTSFFWQIIHAHPPIPTGSWAKATDKTTVAECTYTTKNARINKDKQGYSGITTFILFSPPGEGGITIHRFESFTPSI